ncbi:MAG: TfoX/Sxy family protein [Alphaproteobacteria bacterium]|nr:TfoX/Sxy family protein [Alphaproteobacteria bacterium]MDE2110857.1 TfoX/Sxy family protein [Alphaproteobacteria bacterium]MDE2495469.1 TfoX/Sxy family protein [Alphaproteobacteria bacterium]
MPSGPQPFRPDLFAFFGNVYAKRMFGGYGLFAGDAMIGILHDDLIYLKTNERTRRAFVEEGMKPFVYRKRTGEEVALFYYQIPERLCDEPEEFAQWVRRAQAVAENSPSSMRRKRRVLTKAKRRMGKKPARR